MRTRSIEYFLKCAVKQSGLILTSDYCIRAAVIGKPVSYDEIIPNSSVTFENAIENGELIGSYDIDEKYAPFLSELMIAKF